MFNASAELLLMPEVKPYLVLTNLPLELQKDGEMGRIMANGVRYYETALCCAVLYQCCTRRYE